MKLDTLNQQVLLALQADGRRSLREIARELKVPEATVRSRFLRLTRDGQFRVTVIGDPLKLGLSMMAITLIKVVPGHVNECAEILAKYPGVRFVGASVGSADIIMQSFHESLEAFHDFLTDELPAAAPFITSTESLQITKVVKSSWDWREWFDGSASREMHSS